MRRLLLALTAAALAGCTTSGAVPAVSTGTATPTVTATVPAHCVARGLLPDPACTPGAVNPAVTQANIHSTICVKGWTATVRPPLSWSEPVKRRLMTAYGYARTDSMRTVELDHLVPLELGGAPTDMANLWPELGASPNRKDSVEAAARAAACRAKAPIPLATAQHAIAADWQAFGRQLGVKVP